MEKDVANYKLFKRKRSGIEQNPDVIHLIFTCQGDRAKEIAQLSEE